VPLAAGGQLGVGADDTGGDHRQHPIAFRRRAGRQQALHLQPSHGYRDGLNVTAGARCGDLEQAAGRAQALAAQHAANGGDFTLESTVRYPGIEIDDALEIAEQTEV
jgi:hypothetical protein